MLLLDSLFLEDRTAFLSSIPSERLSLDDLPGQRDLSDLLRPEEERLSACLAQLKGLEGQVAASGEKTAQQLQVL